MLIEQNRPQSRPTSQTSHYLDRLHSNGSRTARNASEAKLNSPAPDEVREAVRYIRSDIENIFTGNADDRAHNDEATSSEDIRNAYWERASQVTSAHGAREHYTLENYFQVDPGRDYQSIKRTIEASHAPDSIPASILDAIDAYHEVLDINPSLAATICTELISRKLADIEAAVETATDAGLSHAEATTRAFIDFVNMDVPFHINSILSKYGTGDTVIRGHANKASFYPGADTVETDTALTLSDDDVIGLVQVYDIQSRPYTETELSAANNLANTPTMQTAILRIHEDLIAFSEDYLQANPERAGGDFRNFSEIFVPKYSTTGLELLPNPKLLRAIVNNILPGVAKRMIEDEVSPDSLTAEDIAEGVRVASREYKLFQTNIGQFRNHDNDTRTTELHSIYKVVCPANALLPAFLEAKLATYYEQEVMRAATGVDEAS